MLGFVLAAIAGSGSLAGSAPTPTTEQFPLRSHPLPPLLAQWQDPTASGDYFAEVQSVGVGYLIWSAFPVRVAWEASDPEAGEKCREPLQMGVNEWMPYMPLTWVEDPEQADIRLLCQRPRLRRDANGELLRARSGETSYKLYLKREGAALPTLAHQFTILISPNQLPMYIQASTRHEMGHALGIWGHSPTATDALYFSQVRNPPSISPRDVNTLKRVYQQATRLGWQMEAQPSA
ncbi:MAG: peptidase [Coleofasciculaceae cyanobacterium SM2_3_26]|nr:peptidase [Coleofasciculaceae cyanobacterium SM2_3_26]